jgi:hypothetical protein
MHYAKMLEYVFPMGTDVEDYDDEAPKVTEASRAKLIAEAVAFILGLPKVVEAPDECYVFNKQH